MTSWLTNDSLVAIDSNIVNDPLIPSLLYIRSNSVLDIRGGLSSLVSFHESLTANSLASVLYGYWYTSALAYQAALYVVFASA